jgi:glycosyltransferase involved in cell wall biosynthesis
MMTGHHLLTISALSLVDVRRRILAIHYHHQRVKPRWQWKLIYALAVRQFSAITFPSQYVRQEAVAIHSAVEAISEVVRNPIAVAEVTSEIDRQVARQSLELPPQAEVVGSAGWLIPRKRVDVFLRVAARVAEERPRALFVIAGDGPERARLVRLAKDLGLGKRLRWLGWLSEMSNFYRSLNVLLFNSDWDAFPTTPLEAMAHGVPLVASLVHGGLGEVVENGRSGILLNRHDVDALRKAVLGSLGIDGATMGLAGRRRVQELCDSDTPVGRMEQLLGGP